MQDVRIERLRLHTSGSNSVAARLALQQRLSQARMQPSFLSSGAILIIRRLDHLPPFDREVGGAQRWTRQLQQRIDELARGALRPAVQYVPENAPSVLFADGVELLACYTRACLAGRRAWYWEQQFPILPSASVGSRILVGWSTHVQALPRMLARLPRDEVTQALRSLDNRALAQLSHQIQMTFQLPFLPHAPALARTRDERNARDASLRVNPRLRTKSPWEEWLPGAMARTLPVAAVSFLGVNYALAMRPQSVYRPRFAYLAARWIETAATLSSSVHSSTAIVPNPVEIDVGTDADMVSIPTQRAVRGPAVDEANNHGPRPDARDDAPRADSKRLAHADSAREQQRVAAIDPGVFTRLGGAFYLLNWLTRMQLPWGIEALAEVNPWEMVAALTAQLLGELGIDHQDDSLWPMIAGLAGEDSGTRWGARMTTPSTFTLASEWLAGSRLETLACVIEVGGDRTRVWSQEFGFLVADLPHGQKRLLALADDFTKFGVELRFTNGDVPVLPPPLFIQTQIEPGFGWWLRRGWPFLQHLLCQTFNKNEQELAMLVQTPAMIRPSATHLDIHFTLSHIDMDIRRAGLDQNPGWAPHWGHIITFFFD